MENLSIEQLEVYNKYINSENIFITGPGGCGKTYLIQLIVDHAKKKYKRIPSMRYDWMCCYFT